MEYNVVDLKSIIRKLKSTFSKQMSTKLELDKCERVIEKLDSFSASCEECQQNLLKAKTHFNQLDENINEISNSEMKQHKQFINQIVSHLEKSHKLVSEGYYQSVYMSLGLSLGIVFGLTIFDNIGLGIPIGFSIGLAIGVSLDADAKKKGKMI